MTAAVSSDLPSLDLVRGELDVEQQSFERRASSLDTKIGVLVAADGVLIGLRPAAPTILDVLAAAAAAVSAVLLIWAFLPRLGGAISPLVLREKYLTAPEQDAKLAVLDTRIQIHLADETQLAQKWARMRAGIAALVVAILLAVSGSTLTLITEGGAHDRRQPAPSGSSSSRGSVQATAAPVPSGSAPSDGLGG